MKWLELRCRAGPEAAEAVAELFARYGHGGIALSPTMGASPEGELAPNWQGPITVTGYLPLGNGEQSALPEIERGLWFLGAMGQVGALETRLVAEEDWANAWKEHFPVHRVGRRIVIKPSWRPYAPKPGEVVLELDPGLAFGTGLHPTTQMCLMALERRLRPGTTVLDLGTGSGILALAAAKLGAGWVLALDIDPVAVEVAAANIAANGLGDRVQVAQGSLPVGQTFDLIVANITARAIAELSSLIAQALRSGGALIAGGLLQHKAPSVVERLAAAGLRRVGQRRQGDWLTLVAFK